MHVLTVACSQIVLRDMLQTHSPEDFIRQVKHIMDSRAQWNVFVAGDLIRFAVRCTNDNSSLRPSASEVSMYIHV